MEEQEEKLQLTVKDGTAEKIFSLSSEKLTIIYSIIFVIVFFAGIAGLIFWGRSDNNPMKGPEPTMQLGSLKSSNQQSQAVAGVQTQVGPEKPSGVPNPSDVQNLVPTEKPTATTEPTAIPKPTNTPTPTNTPAPTAAPTATPTNTPTPSVTPSDTPTPS